MGFSIGESPEAFESAILESWEDALTVWDLLAVLWRGRRELRSGALRREGMGNSQQNIITEERLTGLQRADAGAFERYNVHPWKFFKLAFRNRTISNVFATKGASSVSTGQVSETGLTIWLADEVVLIRMMMRTAIFIRSYP